MKESPDLIVQKSLKRLSKEEKAELKSASTDPVKLYLKRMGSVALLTKRRQSSLLKKLKKVNGRLFSCLNCISPSKKSLSSKKKLNGRKIRS